MDKIYKYIDLSSAIKVLENNAVKLENPHNYNDPFDSTIVFDDYDFSKAISIITEYYFTQKVLEILNKKYYTHLRFFTKLKIKLGKFFLIKNLELSKKQKYYNSHMGMNELAEFIVRSSDEKKTFSYDEMKDDFIKNFKNNINDLRNKYLVACFSKRWDSILMWSHYADKHKGVCIEFDRPANIFVDIEYSKYRGKANMENAIRIALGYKLSGEKADYSDKRIVYCIGRPLIVKAIDWKYEEEVRCIMFPTSEGVFQENDLKLYTMPTKITKIYVGCKADVNSDEYDRLINIAIEKNIEIVNLTESPDSFNLEAKVNL